MHSLSFASLASALLICLQISPALAGIHLENAKNGAEELQSWYNTTSGLWHESGWWNSANIVEILAELAGLDPDLGNITDGVFSHTFNNAQRVNLQQSLTADENCKDAACLDSVPVLQPEGFSNDWYDDGGWWAHAWIKVFDLTGQQVYLQAATDIFDDMVANGYNATCGGLWWKRDKKDNNAIENELFLSLAAHLANRKPNKEYYRDWAVRQWLWFELSGLINQDSLVNDGLNISTCENNGENTWTYNQGVLIGGLIELNRAAANSSYVKIAERIAQATMNKLSDANGILHDQFEADGGEDVPTFKGVFMRNLRVLAEVTDDETYADFIRKNADSIWNNNRNQPNYQLGPVWSGPMFANATNSITQGAALDAIVAAAALEVHGR